MARYGLGSIMQEIHGLRYPIKDAGEFIQQMLPFGDIYVRGKPLTDIAQNIDYPIYSGGDCIDKILDAAKKTKVTGRIFTSSEEHVEESPTRGIPTIKTVSRTPDLKPIAEYTARLKDVENRIKSLKDVKIQIPRGSLTGGATRGDIERESVELELKTALATLKMDREEQLKQKMELELKKAQLEAELRDKERELANRMEIEIKKKMLEMEMREREREMRNRMEIELKKKEIELELKKKELELIAKERNIENEINARVRMAMKEREIEIRKIVDEDAERKIARIRQQLEDEYRKKEELLERRYRLERGGARR